MKTRPSLLAFLCFSCSRRMREALETTSVGDAAKQILHPEFTLTVELLILAPLLHV